MLATLPGGSATAMEKASNAGRPRWTNRAVPPTISARSHRPAEPANPAKHATREIGAGPRTVAVARSTSCRQSVPITFQYSSSWVGNPFNAPRMR